MQEFNSFENEWVVYFGGYGRQKIISHLREKNLNIVRCFVPMNMNENLKKTVEQLKECLPSIAEISCENLESSLNGIDECSILSIGFPFKIPLTILQKAKVALNVHPSLLPNYRGPHPFFYILENNEKFTGSTVHFMTDKIDHGGIVLQNHIELTPFDTYRSIRRKTFDAEPELVFNALSQIDLNRKLKIPSDANNLTYAKRRTPSDSEINPNLPLMDLINKIRACDIDEFPAFFMYEGERVYLRLFRIKNSEDDFL